MFLPSEVTNNDIEIVPDEENDDELPRSGTEEEKLAPVEPLQSNGEDVAGPSSSNTAQHMMDPAPLDSFQRDCQVVAESPSTREMLNELSPFPKSMSTGQSRNKRKSTGSQVLTSTSFMDGVKIQIQNKIERESRKNLRARKQVKRTVLQDDSDDEPVEAFTDDADMDDSDAACLYCNELYSKSKPGDHWVCCQLC